MQTNIAENIIMPLLNLSRVSYKKKTKNLSRDHLLRQLLCPTFKKNLLLCCLLIAEKLSLFFLHTIFFFFLLKLVP